MDKCFKCSSSFVIPHVSKKLSCEKHNTFFEYVDNIKCLQCKAVKKYDSRLHSQECSKCLDKIVEDEKKEDRKTGYQNLLFDFGQLVVVSNGGSDLLSPIMKYKNIDTDIEYSYDLQFDVWKQLSQLDVITLDNNKRSTIRPQVVASRMCFESDPCQHSVSINGKCSIMYFNKVIDVFNKYDYPLPQYLQNHH